MISAFRPGGYPGLGHMRAPNRQVRARALLLSPAHVTLGPHPVRVPTGPPNVLPAPKVVGFA